MGIESLKANKGQRSLRRMEVVISRKMVNTMLERMHDSVTAGHMGIRRTLDCTGLRSIVTIRGNQEVQRRERLL